MSAKWSVSWHCDVPSVRGAALGFSGGTDWPGAPGSVAPWLCRGQSLEGQLWARARAGSCTMLWCQGGAVGTHALNPPDPWHLVRVAPGALGLRDSWRQQDP